MADALQREANKAREYQGKRLSPKRAMAAMSWDGILNGEVTLSNGSKIVLSEEGWLSLLKFVSIHVDGAKPQELRHTGDEGGPIRMLQEVVIGGASQATGQQATGTILDEPSAG